MALSNKKHLFFDLDDTVTKSRTMIEDDGYELFRALPQTVCIVSGAHAAQIRLQVRDLPVFRLGQNGNEAFSPDDVELWREDLEAHHEEAILAHIREVRALCDVQVRDESDLIEHRGSQISHSLIGHNEDLERKRAFDPDRTIRRGLLEQAPFTHDEVEVKIGGTTCFDYFKKGRHKGHNVTRLIAHMGWNRDECVYFGDAIFPGGNDESVIGIIETVSVQNHLDTYRILREQILGLFSRS